ncbi:hypothetical protein JCM10207_006702 [Rhodosporidiobolus poonsookiae]
MHPLSFIHGPPHQTDGSNLNPTSGFADNPSIPSTSATSGELDPNLAPALEAPIERPSFNDKKANTRKPRRIRANEREQWALDAKEWEEKRAKKRREELEKLVQPLGASPDTTLLDLLPLLRIIDTTKKPEAGADKKPSTPKETPLPPSPSLPPVQEFTKVDVGDAFKDAKKVPAAVYLHPDLEALRHADVVQYLREVYVAPEYLQKTLVELRNDYKLWPALQEFLAAIAPYELSFWQLRYAPNSVTLFNNFLALVKRSDQPRLADGLFGDETRKDQSTELASGLARLVLKIFPDSTILVEIPAAEHTQLEILTRVSSRSTKSMSSSPAMSRGSSASSFQTSSSSSSAELSPKLLPLTITANRVVLGAGHSGKVMSAVAADGTELALKYAHRASDGDNAKVANELDVYEAIARYAPDVAPACFGLFRGGWPTQSNVLVTERFGRAVEDIEELSYVERRLVLRRLEDLHRLARFDHGSFRARNILIDDVTRDVKLVDFGRAEEHDCEDEVDDAGMCWVLRQAKRTLGLL